MEASHIVTVSLDDDEEELRNSKQRTNGTDGKLTRKRLEVDFVCKRGNQRYYIQSAFAIPDCDKMQQKQKSPVQIRDSFKKIIVVKDPIKPWRNEEGIVVMGIMDFLLNPNSLDM